MKPNARDALIVIDVQNDFCPGGALAVPDGDKVVEVINSISSAFQTIVMTQDWHPAGHASFASTHNSDAFTTTELHYGTQVLWPDHCVQGSAGARFHPQLQTDNMGLIVRKGMNPEIDSYSAFYENDKTTSTGLTGYLRHLGIKRVFCVGLAFDYCVRYTAEDAVKEQFETVVIGDACGSIDTDGSDALARESFELLGVEVLDSGGLG